MTDGSTATVDIDYLRESILTPGARVVAGYNPVMPTYQGQIGEEELVQLLQYIRSLTPEADTGDGANAEDQSIEDETDE